MKMDSLRRNRSNRTQPDILLVADFVKASIPQVVSTLTDIELKELCNEIDWVTTTESSIVFLQNEPANCYYIIGKGSVSFYYEADDCVSNAIQCSPLLSVSTRFGTLLGQLHRGAGFGEYALLGNGLSRSESSKPKRHNKDSLWNNSKEDRKTKGIEAVQPCGRSCTAVSCAGETLLFVVFEATYNRIFRKYHHAQRQLAHNIHLMKKLPLFRHASLAKVTQIAFKATPSRLPFKAVLGEYGRNIEEVGLLLSGVVRVSSRAEASSSSIVLLDDAFSLEEGSLSSLGTLNLNQPGASMTSSNLAGFPPLPSIAVLKAGQAVGELEIAKGLITYKFHYEVQSLSAEVLQVPFEVFLECARDAAFNDPACANNTILPETERARRSEERKWRLYTLYHSAEEASASPADPSAASAVTVPVSPQSSPATPGPHLKYIRIDEEEGAVPLLEEEEEVRQQQQQMDTSGSAATPLHSPPSPLVPLAAVASAVVRQAASSFKLMVPALILPVHPMASPPQTARPSKASFRSGRTADKLSSGPVPGSGSNVTVSGAVLFPTAPRGTVTPRGAVRASPRRLGAVRASPRRLGAGYVDIIDPLDGEYPPSLSKAAGAGAGAGAGGPSLCTAYASTPHEAQLSIAQELRAIRQRMRVKQKSLDCEDIRVDPNLPLLAEEDY